MLATLREQLDEKDALIEDLSRSLDEPRSRSSRRTRHRSGVSSSDDAEQQLKKEIVTLQNRVGVEVHISLLHISQHLE